MTDTNLKKLNLFHYSAIRWLLRIRWEKVKEVRISNESMISLQSKTSLEDIY